MKTTKSKLGLTRFTLRALTGPELVAVDGGLEPVRTIVMPSDACGVPTSR